MEILSIVTKVPSHSAAYVFGSILSAASANDFDLLVIYDESECPANEAYVLHADLCSELQSAFALPIHLTLLTRSEAKHVRFIERTNAVPLELALKVLIQRLSSE